MGPIFYGIKSVFFVKNEDAFAAAKDTSLFFCLPPPASALSAAIGGHGKRIDEEKGPLYAVFRDWRSAHTKCKNTSWGVTTRAFLHFYMYSHC